MKSMNKIRSMIGRTTAPITAPLTARLLKSLNNGDAPVFSREELRSARFTFSQFGEDLAVLRIASHLGIAAGTYADFGAFDPICLSNTLLLHKQGWRGINVDASSAAIDRFNALRSADHNVVAVLSDKRQTVKFAQYDGQATNRILVSPEETSSFIGEQPRTITEATTATAAEILQDSPYRSGVDYVNIDCEGHDWEVLRGLDLQQFRPRIITIETELGDQSARVRDYCRSHGYSLWEIHGVTSIFVHEKCT